MAAVCLFAGCVAFAQERDTSFVGQPGEDHSMAGKDIIEVLRTNDPDDGNVTLKQSYMITRALHDQIAANASRKIIGYRVRIFFDNSQDARDRSSEIEDSFVTTYPWIPAYRKYENPYFKVSVGDFRTKSDALRFMALIKKDYPSVFLVKEDINYPLFF